MPTILQGSFRHFPADELLTLLASSRHTGTLEVSSQRGKARVVFRDGSLLYAEGPEHATAEEAIYDLYVHSGDTFTFLEQTDLPDGAEPKAMDLGAIAAEGRRRAAEWQRLVQLYPDEEILLRVVEDPKTQSQINLTADEFKILMQIGKGRKLADLRTDLRRKQAELYPNLHRLESAGLLERAPAATSAPPNENAQPAAAPDREEAVSGIPAVGSLTSAAGKLFPLLENLYRIGRDEKNEIAIDDATVSSVHARIARANGSFTVEDAQSRNGTFVNGEKVEAARLLADGDTVRLGKVILTFNLASQAPGPDSTHGR